MSQHIVYNKGTAMKDQIKQRYIRVKVHLKDYGHIYLAAAGGVVVGALAMAAATRDGGTVINGGQMKNIATWKPKQTVEVYIEALGDLGNIVQDTTTGVVYASQGQAARELGLHASDISKQLSGHTNHVKGHVFEKLGKAHVSDA